MEKTDHGENLRRSGLKNTRHRSEILDVLEECSLPLAAEQVYLKLKERGTDVNLSTVYRTLEALAGKGLARKIRITGEGRALYEYNRRLHRHYLVCLGCKKKLPIEHCPLGDFEKALERDTNFTISGHSLDIYGYCPECREKQNNGHSR